jgi:16S rRNA (guanine1207-N2)-methyltransferase
MRHAPYRLSLESNAPEGPGTYRFETADGVASKRSFRTAELLLLEGLWEVDLGRLLCVEANYGVVGTVLSVRADAVHTTESSARAARLCERNARENGADVSVDLVADLATLDRRFDTVAYAPKPYTAVSIGKRRLVDALSLLRPDGRLYLAGSERAGLARYRDCLREVGATVEGLREDDGCRLLAATRPRAFDPPSYVSTRRIRSTVDGVDLSLRSVPGLFSAFGLDRGTRLLLECASLGDGERVLDLCCGYGPIGAYAGRIADCDVWLSDDDRVATKCAECGLRASGVEGTVVTADCLEGVTDRTFDAVLCNPPTHAGGAVLAELLDGTRDVLAPGGRLNVVHHRALDLDEHLARYGDVETLGAGAEHVVLSASR